MVGNSKARYAAPAGSAVWPCLDSSACRVGLWLAAGGDQQPAHDVRGVFAVKPDLLLGCCLAAGSPALLLSLRSTLTRCATSAAPMRAL
jgi:hypothetical protein